jgi:hypothetical protein
LVFLNNGNATNPEYTIGINVWKFPLPPSDFNNTQNIFISFYQGWMSGEERETERSGTRTPKIRN